MKLGSGIVSLAGISILFAGAVHAGTQAEPETALKMLRGQDRQMERKVAKITDNVYTAIGFYGTVPHAVRAIYAGLLGWYDGNPTTLNPLEPQIKAQKIADLAGGIPQLTQRMEAALENEDYQWALELSDHLKWLDDGDRRLARMVKIAALRGLAAREYNAPNRNYYLSYANELESGQLSNVWF